MQNFKEVQLAANAVKHCLPADLATDFQNNGCGLILGTGLSELAFSLVENPVKIPFADIPGFPRAGVASHAGMYLAGFCADLPVLIQCGRLHLYEGYNPAQVCMGTRLMRELGLKNLALTNSAGALNPLFNAGSLMLIADIINHTGLSPLAGPNHDGWGERFPDMSAPLSQKLGDIACQCALENRIPLEKGVYIGVHGPEMETPAETRMYRQWGADAVGMSTVLEIIAARHAGMQCLGLCCLTNKNLPDCMRPAPLAEVIAAAKKAAPDLGILIKAIFTKLASQQIRA